MSVYNKASCSAVARIAFVLPADNLLGESVVWDDRQHAAFWTDIDGRTFWKWAFGTSDLESWRLPERLCSFGLTETDGEFIGAFENGFVRFRPNEGFFDPVASIELNDPNIMMNDGRVDRAGNFWATTKMTGPRRLGGLGGRLWRLDGRNAVAPCLARLQVPNSLAWSVDGKTMYLSDSEQRDVWQFFHDEIRGPLNRSPFVRTVDSKPDGACVDAAGQIWIAQWGGGRINCYSPAGQLLDVVELPVSQPSCVAFGGPCLDHLLVTSARAGLSPAQLASEPMAGAMLVIQTRYVGLAECRCSTDFGSQHRSLTGSTGGGVTW